PLNDFESLPQKPDEGGDLPLLDENQEIDVLRCPRFCKDGDGKPPDEAVVDMLVVRANLRP
ncbi:MAG: hypothetical protein KJ649_12040, partial [Proteobacteria bacterium]|nr:hypothetical protein [Pseudomonadota bacterium]